MKIRQKFLCHDRRYIESIRTPLVRGLAGFLAYLGEKEVRESLREKEEKKHNNGSYRGEQKQGLSLLLFSVDKFVLRIRQKVATMKQEKDLEGSRFP